MGILLGRLLLSAASVELLEQEGDFVRGGRWRQAFGGRGLEIHQNLPCNQGCDLRNTYCIRLIQSQ